MSPKIIIPIVAAAVPAVALAALTPAERKAEEYILERKVTANLAIKQLHDANADYDKALDRIERTSGTSIRTTKKATDARIDHALYDDGTSVEAFSRQLNSREDIISGRAAEVSKWAERETKKAGDEFEARIKFVLKNNEARIAAIEKKEADLIKARPEVAEYISKRLAEEKAKVDAADAASAKRSGAPNKSPKNPPGKIPSAS